MLEKQVARAVQAIVPYVAILLLIKLTEFVTRHLSYFIRHSNTGRIASGH